jgi:hypothetical protein
MHPRLVLTVTFFVVLGACATTSGASPEIVDDTTPGTTRPSTTTTPSTVAPTTLGSDSIPDITVFIAAVNEAAIGTSYEDAALRDPEVFIGVGQLFCELLDDGLTVDSVLTEYLTALEDEETGTVADDDALITGVLMGVSLEILCPRHKDKRG